MKSIVCDFKTLSNKIKPHHSVGNYPLIPRQNYPGAPDAEGYALIRSLLAEVDPPMTRIKSPRRGGYGKMNEICHIFRFLSHDENDPKSYFFPNTDANVKAVTAACEKVIYRLGVPRELYTPPLYINMTEQISYDKIATICLNIVRHINDGWNRGTHAGIKYWEIWDRADESFSFKGSYEDYYKLYAAVATKIKSVHPRLKVGGPSSANCADLTFMKGFLQYVKEHDLPLDFITWHFIGEKVEDAIEQAKAVKRLVREMHLKKKCEIICTEWNCMTVQEDGRYSVPHARDIYGAAFDVGFMIGMQQAGMDSSIFYDCSTGTPWGSFIYPAFFKPYKPLYSFALFAQLYKLKQSVKTTVRGRDLYALAAGDGNKKALLVSYCGTGRSKLSITGFDGKKKVYVMDEKRDAALLCETSDKDLVLTLSGPTVYYIESK